MPELHPSLRPPSETPEMRHRSRLIEFGNNTNEKAQMLFEKMMDIEEEMADIQEEIKKTKSPTPDLETYLTLLLAQHTAIKEAYQRLSDQLNVVEKMVNKPEIPEA